MNFARKGTFFFLTLAVLLFSFLILTNENSIAESTIQVSENAIVNDHIEIIANNSGKFFIFSSDENSSIITCFDANSPTSPFNSLTLDFKYSAAAVCGNDIYVVNKDEDGNMNLQKYTYSNNVFSEMEYLAKLNFKLENKNSLAVNNDGTVYCINEGNRAEIIYINSDNDIDVLSYNSEEFQSISADRSQANLYILTTEKFLRYSNEAFTEFSNVPNDYCVFLNDTILVSAQNIIYKIDGTEIKPLFSIPTSSMLGSKRPSLFGNYICCYDTNKTILCYNLDTQTATKKIEFEDDILAIANSGDKTIVVLNSGTEKSIKILEDTDLIDIESTSEPGENPNEPDLPEQPETPKTFNLSSPLYNFDTENNIITGISASTTIATFKDNINNPDNLSMTFTNYLEKSVTSGKLGTNSKVSFSNQTGENVSFRIIILGDITGEGNINSRDKTYMYNHLFSKTELEWPYLMAADINQDGVVDTLDLLLMDKAI